LVRRGVASLKSQGISSRSHAPPGNENQPVGVEVLAKPVGVEALAKPVGVEALAGGPTATTFNGAPTPTG